MVKGKSRSSKKTRPMPKLSLPTMTLEQVALALLAIALIVFVGYHVYQYFKSTEPFEDVVVPTTEEETKMVDVDAENQTLTDGSVVEIVFCKMEGCGHCVKFNDNVWESDEVQKMDGTQCPRGVLKLKIVDPNHEYSKDVDGFPTIKKVINGETVETFEDERTVEKFCAWMKQ